MISKSFYNLGLTILLVFVLVFNIVIIQKSEFEDNQSQNYASQKEEEKPVEKP